MLKYILFIVLQFIALNVNYAFLPITGKVGRTLISSFHIGEGLSGEEKELLEQKLADWKKLKELGLLNKIDTAEDVVRLDKVTKSLSKSTFTKYSTTTNAKQPNSQSNGRTQKLSFLSRLTGKTKTVENDDSASVDENRDDAVDYTEDDVGDYDDDNDNDDEVNLSEEEKVIVELDRDPEIKSMRLYRELDAMEAVKNINTAKLLETVSQLTLIADKEIFEVSILIFNKLIGKHNLRIKKSFLKKFIRTIFVKNQQLIPLVRKLTSMLLVTITNVNDSDIENTEDDITDTINNILQLYLTSRNIKKYIKSLRTIDTATEVPATIVSELDRIIDSIALYETEDLNVLIESLKPTSTINVGSIKPSQVKPTNDKKVSTRKTKPDQNHVSKLSKVIESHSVLQECCFRLFTAMETSGSLRCSVNAESVEKFVNNVVHSITSESSAHTVQALNRDLKNNSLSDVQEVIFIGRSNAGKSSLLNALLNRKQLAAVSATPGHTRNFHLYTLQLRQPVLNASGYSIDNQLLRVVDVPGLGFAVNSNDTSTVTAKKKPIKKQNYYKPGSNSGTIDFENAINGSASGDFQQHWEIQLRNYLSVRKQCSVVMHLIDCRHPLQQVDRQIIELVQGAAASRTFNRRPAFNYYPVLTKLDKVPSNSRKVKIESLKEEINHYVQSQHSNEQSTAMEVISTSSETRVGMGSLWQAIFQHIR